MDSARQLRLPKLSDADLLELEDGGHQRDRRQAAKIAKFTDNLLEKTSQFLLPQFQYLPSHVIKSGLARPPSHQFPIPGKYEFH